MVRRVVPALCIAVLMVAQASSVLAQGRASIVNSEASTTAAPEFPADLSPEMVDALLARLTDAEIRALLREELRRRAEERAAAEVASDATLISIETRLTEMAANIEARIGTWANALANIGNRREPIREKLARAGNGVGGMIAASLAVALAGIAA
ncbi:MAG TPA: hypothetical protein VIK47_04105, partial [Kiloniellales bacterium]